MGLDTVELVLEVEETFGTSIPDEAAEKILTMGDLYDYIVAQRFAHKPDAAELARQRVARLPCLTSATFYEVRRGLMSVLRVARRDVRPSTELARLLPKSLRRRAWKQLCQALGLNLPCLHRPAWLSRGIAVASFVAAFAACLLFFETAIGPLLLFTLLLGAMLAAALFAATAPLATQLRPEISTVGGFSRSVLWRNYRVLAEKHNAWNPDDVWNTLCAVVAGQLGVDPDTLTRETDFIKDLA